ncbi:hypothetical protein C5167_048227 [Papaver somniferum]|uniref:Ataxin-10 domain-containing protein n=2 Tax=Papaver somniferum TaxID=3469 RepID=A0A4Y7KLI7_PAPSO|nr:hypothetical protein C5167_048227 [Papaver somniferum]
MFSTRFHRLVAFRLFATLVLNKKMENTSPLTLVVPEHILDPLLASANCAKLDQALENLIETAKTPDGRLNLASVKILPIILDLIRCQMSSSNHVLVTLSLKLLRNLCAGEILNQNCFIEEDGVDVVARAFDSICFDTNFGDEIIEIIRFGLELLGNVCGAGEEHQAAVWFRLFPVLFKDIARVRVKKISDVLSMVLYSCCNGSNEIMRQLCEVQGLQIVAEIVTTASRDGLREDWLLGLLAKICLEESYFSPLFFMLSTASVVEKNNNLKDTDDIFTLENEFLLSVLYETLNKKRNELVPKKFALSVLGILKRVVTVVDFFSRGQSKLPTGTPAVDVLGYSINILRDICAQDRVKLKSEESVTIVDLLLSSGLLDLLIDFLRELEPPSTIKKSFPQESASVQLKFCPYKGFRRDIVAVIANCLYGMKHVQDAIRQKDAILLLLQQCVTDDDNEFLRECGIWAVRNLLEGNEENQKIVAELEIQGSADVPALTELGFRMELDPHTRRAKLVNISPR